MPSLQSFAWLFNQRSGATVTSGGKSMKPHASKETPSCEWHSLPEHTFLFKYGNIRKVLERDFAVLKSKGASSMLYQTLDTDNDGACSLCFVYLLMLCVSLLEESDAFIYCRQLTYWSCTFNIVASSFTQYHKGRILFKQNCNHATFLVSFIMEGFKFKKQRVQKI